MKKFLKDELWVILIAIILFGLSLFVQWMRYQTFKELHPEGTWSQFLTR